MGSFKKRILLCVFLVPLKAYYRFTRPLRGAWRRLAFRAMAAADMPGLDPSVQLDGPIRLPGTRRVEIGPRSRLGADVEMGTEESGRILIGSDVRINRGCTIAAYDEVRLGDFAMIGEFCSIRDANHGLRAGMPIRHQPHSASPIRIGRDVWLGRGVCVLPGVEIGDGAVIGANAVVTRSIPAGAIAVGAPAKVIGERRP